MSSLSPLAWPADRLGDAMAALAQRSGLEMPRIATTPSSPASPGEPERFSRWVEVLADQLGLEAIPAETTYADAGRLIRGAGPALLGVGDGDARRFLALLDDGRGDRVTVVGPDLDSHSVSVDSVRKTLCQPLESRISDEVEAILDTAEIHGSRRDVVREAVLRERLGPKRIDGCWLVGTPPHIGLRRAARRVGLLRALTGLLSAHALQYLLWILSWWILGRAVLEGRLDAGWLLAWILLLATIIPLRMVVTWLQGSFSIRAGALLKQRLLHGVSRLEPDAIRHQGIGQLLGRVIESQEVESMALNGGLNGLVALVELFFATLVLGFGAAPWIHVALLPAWWAFAGLLAWRYFRLYEVWTRTRLDLTHDLVERMIGHRTQLAQQPRDDWHDEEDAAVARYLDLSADLDRLAVRLRAWIPRGWLTLGLVALTPAFVLGTSSPARLAVSLGGILLAFRAFWRLVLGLATIGAAVVAWRQIAPIFRAGSRSSDSPTPLALSRHVAGPPPDDQPLLEAHDLIFRYRDRGEPVLRGVSLRVEANERFLIEGSSGGGKSTLVSVLVGLRTPESGLLFLRGLDQQSLGAGAWRERVVAAPQFHENHVFTETLAFNLLMGRRWPPEKVDVAEAETVCRELGLGELLERMPAGVLQMVGESGWQLSHGERSRLYIARALLQRADVVVLDESFAALDPENLTRCVRAVLDRTSTVLVIHHS